MDEPARLCDVWSSFDGGWHPGFEVAETVQGDGGVAYQLRRRSDGAVLPRLFPPDDVRLDRPQRSWR